MKTIIISIYIFFTATFLLTASQSAHVRIVFPFNPSNVVLHLWGSYSQDFAMSHSGTNEFSVTIPGVNQYMLFNVSYDLPAYSITNWWIGAGNEYRAERVPARFDAHGLKYGKVYINNQLINNAYTVENGYETGLNIAVRIKDDTTIEPHKIAGINHLFVDDRIPAEVHHRYSYLNTQLPNANHIRITGWLQALSDNNTFGKSKIEVDYIRVYGRKGNDSVLLVSNEYSSYSSHEDGGLYQRYPFFPPGFDQYIPMPGTVTDGVLTFYPSDVRDMVWHWWSHWHNTPISFNYDSYKMISRIRITGHAVVQGGIDFRDAAEKTYELGVSGWYFEKGGEWQKVVFDSGTFQNSSVTPSVNNVKVAHLVVSGNEGFMLRYANLDPGEYCIYLFDVAGKLLKSYEVSLYNHDGLLIMKSENVNNNKVFLYEIKNSTGTVFRGKLIQ